MPVAEKTVAQITCPDCDLTLPLRLTRRGERAALWVCNRCERKFAAIYEPDSSAVQSRRVRLGDTHFDTSNSYPVPNDIQQLVRRLAEREAARCQLDKRRSRRVPKGLIVDAVCLDGRLVPDEHPFKITVFDLSQEGAGLLHTEPLKSPYIAFQMMPDKKHFIQVFAKVVRCMHFDDTYYSIGCEFYTRLGDLRRVS